MQDLTVADHPTTDPHDQPGDIWDDDERETYLALLREPAGYRLIRSLNLTKYFMTNSVTGERYSVPTQGFLGEVYEYRSVLRLDKRCSSIRPVAGGLEGDLERCTNRAQCRAVAYQGYPVVDDSWVACLPCSFEEIDTDFVDMVDGQPVTR